MKYSFKKLANLNLNLKKNTQRFNINSIKVESIFTLPSKGKQMCCIPGLSETLPDISYLFMRYGIEKAKLYLKSYKTIDPFTDKSLSSLIVFYIFYSVIALRDTALLLYRWRIYCYIPSGTSWNLMHYKRSSLPEKKLKIKSKHHFYLHGHTSNKQKK